jgi:hypothetical protein
MKDTTRPTTAVITMPTFKFKPPPTAAERLWPLIIDARTVKPVIVASCRRITMVMR